MLFSTPLTPATLLRRYKRFLADIRLPDGSQSVAHVANPGAMTGAADPGACIWVDHNDDPRKALRHGWRLTEHADGTFTGVDTGAANRVVREALVAGQVPGLPFATLRAEVRYGTASRADFLLSGNGPDVPDTWIEVKSATLCRVPGLVEFPDCVTARGTRHLGDLTERARAGDRAVLLYLVQRTGCDRLAVAADIDPDYAAALQTARTAGVEVLALGTDITPCGIVATGPVPIVG